MKLKKNQVVEIADRLDAVCRRLRKEEKKFREAVEGVHPLFRKSARNLVHYYLLRSGEEVRHIQNDLAQLGFCGMGDLEGHVLDGLMTTRDMLRRLVGLKDAGGKASVTRREAERIFRGHTMALFGKKIKGSPTRIMVTLPSEAAEQHNLVRRYAEAGMNVARINCAHDGPGDWQKMAAHVRRARKKTGRNCRVAMDLGGPKIRTGSLEEGPRVLHLHPERDALGRVVAPARAVFLAEGGTARAGEAAVQVNGQFVGQAKRGDSLCFVDARGKRCRFAVSAVEDGRVAVDFQTDLLDQLAVQVGHGLGVGAGDQVRRADEQRRQRWSALLDDGQPGPTPPQKNALALALRHDRDERVPQHLPPPGRRPERDALSRLPGPQFEQRDAGTVNADAGHAVAGVRAVAPFLAQRRTCTGSLPRQSLGRWGSDAST